jgi:hypothetical protein
VLNSHVLEDMKPFWLVSGAYLPLFTGSFSYDVQGSRTTVLGLFEPCIWRLSVAPKVDNYLPCVYSHIHKDFIVIKISVRTSNSLMQSFLFHMVLVHEAIDFWIMSITVCTTALNEKNSSRKELKDLDYVLNLPLNEFKWGLLIALNHIACKLIFIFKNS